MLKYQTKITKVYGMVIILGTVYGRLNYKFNSLASEIIHVQPMQGQFVKLFDMKNKW